MECLMGTHFHTIDSKGRLSIPSKFRSVLGESFVISMGMDHNLYLYSDEAWSSFQDALNNLNMLESATRTVKRFFAGGSARVEVDSHGRILVPANLQQFAGLTKDVTIVGTGNGRAEIWDSEAYQNSLVDMDINQALDTLFNQGVVIK